MYSASWVADPAAIHHAWVVELWAQAVFLGYPDRRILDKVLAGAKAGMGRPRSPWAAASDPGCVLVLLLARLGWAAPTAGTFITQTGDRLDIRKVSPRLVAALGEEATRD